MPWTKWCLLKQYVQCHSLIILINFDIRPLSVFQVVCNNINIQLAPVMGSNFRGGDGFHCILEEEKTTTTDKLHNVAKVWLGRREIKKRHYHILGYCGRDRFGRGCKQKIKDLKMCVFLSLYKVEPSSTPEKKRQEGKDEGANWIGSRAALFKV